MKIFSLTVLAAGAAFAGTLQMPPTCTTPDGMAVDPSGRLVIAAPNNNHKQPGALFRLSAPGGAPEKWFDVPAYAESGWASPMGVCFGPDGELYVCDNQKAGHGRLLRLTFKDDKVATCETIACGLENANGVKYLNGRLYLTQAFLRSIPAPDGALTSGLYMFSAKDRNVRVTNTEKDPQLVFKDVTAGRVKVGLNGVAVTSKGVIYTGNYGAGRVWKLTPGEDGRIAKSEVFVKPEAGVKTPDGLCVDDDDNLYIADMHGNQSVKVTPAGEVKVVQKGGFRAPSEPCVWRGNLYISNYGGTTVEETPLR
ncbi:MAG: SMP-30/gluconolactonase/LRE family protein [Kiritimatiellae bacterium]|nr:SMP-30/gluconolactonase/LRE family protein [Kiritimatiellia bacterium]